MWRHRCSNTRVQQQASHNAAETSSDHVEVVVPSDLATKSRLDAYLASRFIEHSRSFFGSLCEQGLVVVNGKQQDKSYKVGINDKIAFTLISKVVTKVEPENIPIDIIYEDEHILAINKPSGMVVHPAVGSPNGTFVNALLYHLGAKRADEWFAQMDTSLQSMTPEVGEEHSHNVPDFEDDLDDVDLDLPETPEAASASPSLLRPGIVHRLDKGTTGVLLAAKHPTSLDRISKLFSKRNIRKTYLAICVGHPGDTTIVEPIGRSTKNRQLMTVTDGLSGKPAITHTRTLAFDGKLSVVLVRIETGRTHQIRVHMKERRTPILGDSAYGNGEWNKRFLKSHDIRRPLLHAYETEFVHPFTQKTIVLRAPLPADFRSLVEKISSTVLFPAVHKIQLVDPVTHLLLGSTEVRGRDKVLVGGDDSLGEYDEEYFDEYDEAEETDENGDVIIDGRSKQQQFRSQQVGGTRVVNKLAEGARSLAEPNVYVPSDRLRLEEEDWMAFNLPEDESFFR